MNAASANRNSKRQCLRCEKIKARLLHRFPKHVHKGNIEDLVNERRLIAVQACARNHPVELRRMTVARERKILDFLSKTFLECYSPRRNPPCMKTMSCGFRSINRSNIHPK